MAKLFLTLRTSHSWKILSSVFTWMTPSYFPELLCNVTFLKILSMILSIHSYIRLMLYFYKIALIKGQAATYRCDKCKASQIPALSLSTSEFSQSYQPMSLALCILWHVLSLSSIISNQISNYYVATHLDSKILEPYVWGLSCDTEIGPNYAKHHWFKYSTKFFVATTC